MIYNIFFEIVKLFLEMGPYILLGLFFVGALNLLVSKDLITKHIGSNSFMSVLKAAMFGVPLPLCSCGVVPTAVYMSKNGASKGATISFLISTPQTGIDSILATYGMMGLVFAIYRPFAALVMGVVGGIAVHVFDKGEFKNPEMKPKFIPMDQFKPMPRKSFSQRFRQTLNYSLVEFFDDISTQFVFGLIVAGLISYFIPADFFENTSVSNGILGMLLMMAVGIPMYVCATASIPIALTLMMKGVSPGVAFVFLVTGPATNAASLTILMKTLGKKVTAIYLLVIMLSSIGFGYLLDFIFNTFTSGYSEEMHHHLHQSSWLTDEVKIVIGIIFLIMIIMSFNRKYFAKYFRKKEVIMPETTKVNIDGMTCNHCVMNVRKTIEKLPGVESVDVKLDENAAYIKGKFDMKQLIKDIDDVGYKVV
jgi:hypothetical protein